jgi:Zn-dependent peptidase ImmA (M78 family)
MPSESLLHDSRELYSQMVTVAGYNNPEVIKKYIANDLAKRYEVSAQAMKFRLEKWPVEVMDKIDRAMKDGLDFLD